MSDEIQYEGYRSDNYISSEYKVSVIARMLAGYDEPTWKKLRKDRQLTYRRAASAVLFEFEKISAKVQEFKEFEEKNARRKEHDAS